MTEYEAREQLLKAALRVFNAEREDAALIYAPDELAYANEKLALAAITLVTAIESVKDTDQRPVGWATEMIKLRDVLEGFTVPGWANG